ncbi:hypothetical protein WS63_31550 [Burkholderia stagnalis]|nr:hypothetical protein WS63_31550 [Burkholderia stagnalis]KWK24706.1 hypothetical protein WT77_15520 [Burkholderia stagnalis]
MVHPRPRAGEPLPCAPAPRTFATLSPLFALDRIWIHPGELLVDVAVHRSARRIITRSPRACG